MLKLAMVVMDQCTSGVRSLRLLEDLTVEMVVEEEVFTSRPQQV
jgi:hypothetical protein